MILNVLSKLEGHIDEDICSLLEYYGKRRAKS